MNGELLKAGHGGKTVKVDGGYPVPRMSAIALGLSLALAGVVGAATPVAALAQSATVAQQPFSIPAGNLRQALDALASQSGATVMYTPELVAGKTTRGVTGNVTTTEALRRLLEGTGLESRQNGGDTFVLRQTPAADRPAPATRPAAKGNAVDQGGPVTTLPELLVQGTRSLNVDVQRTEDDPQPYVVLGREEIERSGATNVQDFLRRRLPMNNTSFTASDQSLVQVGGMGGNRSHVNLRGLSGQTLILVNGRRVANLTLNGAEGQPDLNGIPLAMIERIEVLPTTASGIYGGGATGGVINVILKKDYSGVDVGLHYGDAFAGGAARNRVDVSAGFSLEDGKTHVTLAASREYANPLLRGERGFPSEYLADLYAATPGPKRPPLTGSTTNISSATGENLVLDNGIVLGASFTSVPLGYAGVASDGGAGLVTRAGQYNTAPPLGVQGTGLDALLLAGSEVTSISGNVQREFGQKLSAFLDVMYSRNRSSAPTSDGFGSIFLMPDDPGNPFQQMIYAAVPSTSAGGVGRTILSDLRLTGGLIFDLMGSWRGGVDYTWERTSSKVYGQPMVVGPGATAAVASGAIDVFRDANAYPIDLTPYLVGGGFNLPSDTTVRNAALRLGGQIGRLPGGAPEVAVLLESRRNERAENATYAGDALGYTLLYPDRSQSVRSAYAEARFPFVSAQNRKRFVEALDLQLGVRHDRYTSRGVTGYVFWFDKPDMRPDPLPPTTRAINEVRSTDFTAALKWTLIEDLALRASYGTGFQPPSVDQLVTLVSPPGVCGGIPDPARGNTLMSNCISLTGGNPDLKPEQSESWSAGVILTPRFAPGLRLSVDYVSIRKTDNIAAIFSGTMLEANARDGSFSDRVIRGDRLPGDPPGWAGPVTMLDETLMNFATAELKAVDAQLEYQWEARIGTFNLFALGTYQSTYKTQLIETQPEIERVGFWYGPVKYKGNIGIDWTQGSWGAGWSASYYHSYLVHSPGSSQSVINNDVTIHHGPNTTIPSQTYHDGHISYRLSESMGWLSDAIIQLSISNILNKKPPRWRYEYSSFGDPRLSRYMLSFNASF